MKGTSINLNTSADYELYLPVIGSVYFPRERNCPVYVEHNYFKVRTGRVTELSCWDLRLNMYLC